MIALLLALALAAEPPEPEEEVLSRRLPAVSVDSAFANTYLAFRQGGGLLTLRGYEIPDLGVVDLQLGGLSETLEFQGRVRPWLALGGRLGGSVVVGTNLDSAFVSGAEASGSVEAWTRVALHQGPRGVLSLRVGIRGVRGAGLTPSTLADAFARNRWDTLSAVLRGQILEYVLGQRSATVGLLGVSGARELGRGWSVQGAASGRVGSVSYQPLGRPERAVRTSRTNLGLGGAVAWEPEGKVPLGGVVEVITRQESEGRLAGELGATEINQMLAAGTLAYTGREELFLGLTLGTRFPTLKPGAEQLTSLEATFRYDF